MAFGGELAGISFQCPGSIGRLPLRRSPESTLLASDREPRVLDWPTLRLIASIDCCLSCGGSDHEPRPEVVALPGLLRQDVVPMQGYLTWPKQD